MAEERTVHSLKYFQNRLSRLVALDKDRDEMFQAFDEMDHGEWTPPEEFDDISWVDPLVSTEQHDVLQAGARIISDSVPKFKVMPRSIKGGSEAKVDVYERGLQSLFHKADRRREASVVGDAGFSALKYAECAISVLFLPEQIRSAKAIGSNMTRYEALKRGGEFIVTVNNPKNVHVRYSDLGVEEVGLIKTMDPYEVVDLYGEKAVPNLVEALEALGDDVTIDEVVFKDYFNYSERCVWIEWTRSDQEVAAADEIYRNLWNYPFLPWACKLVGTSTEDKGDHRRRSLLYTSYHMDTYDIMNRVKSLRYSEMIRYAGISRRVLYTDSDIEPTVDPSSPDLLMTVRDSEARMQDLAPPMPDPSMTVLHHELRQELEASTLSKILMGAQPPSGTAFATMNLVTHSAMAVLKPFQEMLEHVIAEVATIMLLWLHYSPASKQIITEGFGDEDFGQEYKLNAKDILPNRLLVMAELSSDVPTDHQGRALTAINLNDRDIISKRQAMSDVGVQDVTGMEDQIVQEKLDNNELMIHMKNRSAMADRELRDQMLQQAMMMIQAEMQRKQADTAGAPIEEGGRSLMGGGGQDQPRQSVGQEGIEGLEGDLVNPAAGGSSAAVHSPYQTREAQTGQTVTKEDIA